MPRIVQRYARARAFLRVRWTSAPACAARHAGRTRAAASPAVERVREQIDASAAALRAAAASRRARPAGADASGLAAYAACAAVRRRRRRVDADAVAGTLRTRAIAVAGRAHLAAGAHGPACAAVLVVRSGVDARLTARDAALPAHRRAGAGIAERRSAFASYVAPSAVLRIGRDVDACVSARGRAGGAAATAGDALLGRCACRRARTAMTRVAGEVDARGAALAQPGRARRGARPEIAKRCRASARDPACTAMGGIRVEGDALAVAREIHRTRARVRARIRRERAFDIGELEGRRAATSRDDEHPRCAASEQRYHLFVQYHSVATARPFARTRRSVHRTRRWPTRLSCFSSCSRGHPQGRR